NAAKRVVMGYAAPGGNSNGLWALSPTSVAFLVAGTQVFKVDSSGSLAIGYASLAAYQLDVRFASAIGSSIHVRTNGVTDDGGYIGSTTSNDIHIAGGVAFDGTHWKAKDTSTAIFNPAAGAFAWYANTGQTIGGNVTPTQVLALDTSLLTLGVTLKNGVSGN